MLRLVLKAGSDGTYILPYHESVPPTMFEQQVQQAHSRFLTYGAPGEVLVRYLRIFHNVEARVVREVPESYLALHVDL